MSQPILYQVNARLLTGDLSRQLGRPATLDDIPAADLDDWAALGFDYIYMLGVWQLGVRSRQISLDHPDLQAEYAAALPDFTPADVCGSCFAVADYHVDTSLGGDDALARFRKRLRDRDMRLLLDFVPNHTGLDHAWIDTHPEFYVTGTSTDLAAQPGNYTRINDQVFAHGRDPYFPGWSDTLQLNYANPALQAALRDEVLRIATQCDGVRCDMAMLVLPEIFQHTWGLQIDPFWHATIRTIKQSHPEFIFMAEVYWDYEAELISQGFDYAYDKRLYDRLRDRQGEAVRRHFQADPAYQEHLVRFLENHDEKRAAAVFPPGVQEAAALATFFAPGLKFFHQGQLAGWRIKLPIQLCRAGDEPVDVALNDFYTHLLEILRSPAVQQGSWQPLVALHPTGGEQLPALVAHAWQASAESESPVRLLAVVNYQATPLDCLITQSGWLPVNSNISMHELLAAPGGSWHIAQDGLHLSLPGWGYVVIRNQA